MKRLYLMIALVIAVAAFVAALFGIAQKSVDMEFDIDAWSMV